MPPPEHVPASDVHVLTPAEQAAFFARNRDYRVDDGTPEGRPATRDEILAAMRGTVQRGRRRGHGRVWAP